MSTRSAASDRAAKIARSEIEKRYQRLATAALAGNLAAERGAALLALGAGIQTMRQMIGLSALAEAEPKDLVRVLAPLFELLLEAPTTR